MTIIIDDDGVMHKVFTKDDMVAILENLKKEIENTVKEEELIDKKWAMGLHYSKNIIQQKIDALKENGNDPCLSCDKAYVEDIWNEWCCDEKECPHVAESEENDKRRKAKTDTGIQKQAANR